MVISFTHEPSSATSRGSETAFEEVGRIGIRKRATGVCQTGCKGTGESDDDWRRSDDSYSPRRHWRLRSPTISVGPRFAYRRVMTLVSFDDDLDWEFAFDSRLGHPTGSSEEPMAKRSKKRCEQLPILHPDAAGIHVGASVVRCSQR